MNEITIKEIKEMTTDTFSVKDNSPRGVHTACKSEIKIGEKVVINNHFVTVVA